MTLRVVDPAEGAAAIKATTAPTRLQRCEAMLRVFMKATEGMWLAAQAGDERKARVSFEMAMDAHKAAELLLNPPEPPQAA